MTSKHRQKKHAWKQRIGRIYVLMDQDARSAAEIAEHMMLEVEDPQLRTEAAIAAAHSRRRLGDPETATLRLTQAASLAETHQLPSMRALVFVEVAKDALTEGKVGVAYHLISLALLEFLDLGDFIGFGKALLTQGEFEYRRKNDSNAETILLHGIEILDQQHSESENPTLWRYLSTAHQLLGCIYVQRKKFKPAARHFALAHAIAPPQAIDWCARLLWSRAEVAEILGDFDTAEIQYLDVQMVLTGHPMERAWLNIDVGRIQYRLGKNEEAAAEIAAAREILIAQAESHEPARRALKHLSADPDELWKAREALMHRVSPQDH